MISYLRRLACWGIVLAGMTATTSPIAAPLTVTLEGVVCCAEPGNDLGLDTGDIVGGTITYDAALLTGTGFESLTPVDDPLLSVTFDFGGFIVSETDDIDFPDFPELFFVDGAFAGIDFIAEFSCGSGAICELEIFEDLSFAVFTDNGFVDGVLFVVAEPGSLGLLLAGLLALGMTRRRAAVR